MFWRLSNVVILFLTLGQFAQSQFAQSLIADPHPPVTPDAMSYQTTATMTAHCLWLDSSVGGERMLAARRRVIMVATLHGVDVITRTGRNLNDGEDVVMGVGDILILQGARL